MKDNRKILLAEALRDEIDGLRRVQREAAKDRANFIDLAPETSHDLHGVAGVLTDIYQGAENTFQRIARATGEPIPVGPEWHRELLDQMSREASGFRPAVIRPETRAALDSFRGFRHVARHSYGFDLQWKKMQPLLEVSEQTVTLLVDDLETFCAFLEQINEDEA